MNNRISSILKTKQLSRLIQNKPLIRGLLIVSTIFCLFIGSIFIIPSANKANKPNAQEEKELNNLEQSIQTVRKKTSPFLREYYIQKESRRLNLTLDNYRHLYNVSNKNLDFIPDIPENSSNIISWYYQDLNSYQRFQVLKDKILLLVNILSKLGILFVIVRFILEIPEREKQAKYQAWQVIHTAHGQTSSGARIAALEYLVTKQESLQGLRLEEGTYLNGANLEGARLDRAYLNGANLFEANLNRANLNRANLNGANLDGAYLFGATYTNDRIKSACNWEKAIYTEATWTKDLDAWIPYDVPGANDNKIEEIRNDTASDPQQPPNCRQWK